ncbi:hypothetical protein ABZ484_35040 [Streptomyces sp. NPDC006393]|uniref:hypothetical protein n=1 Tax=Streptomyces sp. NPDC006393 TaxID=3156763 RepID=UPI0033ECB52A
MIVIALLVPEILLIAMFALTALENLLFPPPVPRQEQEVIEEQPLHPHGLPGSSD